MVLLDLTFFSLILLFCLDLVEQAGYVSGSWRGWGISLNLPRESACLKCEILMVGMFVYCFA